MIGNPKALDRYRKLATKRVSLFVIAISACVFVAAPSVAADQSDQQLSEGLVGFWTTANDHLNALERKNIERGVFAVEQFSGDGSAKITVYYDKKCGPVAAVSKFSWYIRDGVLITIDHGDRQHDKFISLDQDTLVLSSDEHQMFEYRVRTAACPQ